MRFSAEQDIHDGSAEADESFVRKEIERIRGFVGNLSMGDLRQGTWKLIHRDDLSCCRWFRGGVSQKTKGGLPRDN